MSRTEEQTPILTITTSKNWVLPPRPKNSRKNRATAEKKKLKSSLSSCEKAVQPTKSVSNKAFSALPTSLSQAMPPLKSLGSLPATLAKKSLPIKLSIAPHSKLPAYHDKPQSLSPSRLASAHDLKTQIKAIDSENYHLKTKLLLLIHDYRGLKSLVTSASSQSFSAGLYDTATTARKRVFNEMGDGIMSDLISDLNHLSHACLSPLEQETDPEQSEAELFNFVNIDLNQLHSHEPSGAENSEKESDSTLLKDAARAIIDEFVYSEPIEAAHSGNSLETEKSCDDIDEEIDDDFVFLSRLTSPLVSEADENLLMTSLTRSTTVSTNNSFLDKKSYPKFFELPVFSEDDDGFLFEKLNQNDKMMSVIEEDHYNQVADFLEEKLMSNDVKYYVNGN